MRQILAMWMAAVKIVAEIFALWTFTIFLAVLLSALDKIRAHSLADRVSDWMAEKYIPHIERRKTAFLDSIQTKLYGTDV